MILRAHVEVSWRQARVLLGPNLGHAEKNIEKSFRPQETQVRQTAQDGQMGGLQRASLISSILGEQRHAHKTSNERTRANWGEKLTTATKTTSCKDKLSQAVINKQLKLIS